VASKEAKLKYRYGITLVDYNTMLKKQDHRCKICDVENTCLVVDHCHASGAIRGLLCNNCNKALGFFKDSPERMVKAADYINENKTETINGISSKDCSNMDKLHGVYVTGTVASSNNRSCNNSPKGITSIGPRVSFIGPFLEDLQVLGTSSTVSGNSDNC